VPYTVDRTVRCIDCADPEPGLYFVHNEVWAAAGLQYHDGFICLECLARRLGRRLEHADFPIRGNDWLYKLKGARERRTSTPLAREER
jgi:hypothetical protein